jgi:hypothetical protein
MAVAESMVGVARSATPLKEKTDPCSAEVEPSVPPPPQLPSQPQQAQLQAPSLAQPQAEPQAEPQAQPQAQPQAHPQAQPQEQSQAQPPAQPRAPSQAQPQADLQVQPRVQSQAQPQAQPQAQSQAQPQTQSQAEPKVQPRSHPWAQASVLPQVQAGSGRPGRDVHAKRQRRELLRMPLARDQAYMEQAAAILPTMQTERAGGSAASASTSTANQDGHARRLAPMRMSWETDADTLAVFDMQGAAAVPIVRISFLPSRAVELTARFVSDVSQLVYAARPMDEVVSRALHCMRTMSLWPLEPRTLAATAAAQGEQADESRLFQRTYYLEAFYNSIAPLLRAPHLSTFPLAELTRTYEHLQGGSAACRRSPVGHSSTSALRPYTP